MRDDGRNNCTKNTIIANQNEIFIPHMKKHSVLFRNNHCRKIMSASALGLLMAVFFTACQSGTNKSSDEQMDVKESVFGTFEGKEVKEFKLTNNNGMEVKLINYGAIVTSILAPDREGQFENVVLGFDAPDGYWTEPYSSDVCYLGAIVGRYGNRIAEGRFSLMGEEYILAVNNAPNHLHGGIKGFDKVVWEARTIREENYVGVELSYVSADGEEGYPGTFQIRVQYLLTDDNELKIEYFGDIDKACPVNVTHHGYFNLNGNAKRDILNHVLMIQAERYTVVDQTLIPTGELRPVEGTPMDFRKPMTIGSRIDSVDGGYDHNYVLSETVTDLRKVVEVVEPESGRMMEVFTTEPGVQFYSGNFLNGSLTGNGGARFNRHWGFCLETQHFPDSPNQPAFPSTILEPGQKYRQTTIYRFGVR